MNHSRLNSRLEVCMSPMATSKNMAATSTLLQGGGEVGSINLQ